MKKKIRVAVLMGGNTTEHEISIISGKEIVKNLSKKKYQILPILISRSGKNWQFVPVSKLKNIDNATILKGIKENLVVSGKQISGVNALVGKVDVVFIAIHGTFGEDGAIQGMLDVVGIKYTGSGVLASALGMDKLRFRMIMESNNIPVPKYVALKRGQPTKKVFENLGNPPYFVKPHNQGSSVGTSLVQTKKDLKQALTIAFKFSQIALVDQYLEGTETTCAVLGNEKPFPLPLVEIVPLKGAYFNYDSKYSKTGAKEIVPARISSRLTKKIQQLSIQVYQALGCAGFSRVDFIVKNNRTPIVLEINTIPGLTPMSLFPKSAKFYGLEYPQLIDKIITYARKQ